MKNKVELKDGQYFVNGRVFNDTDIVRAMTKWASENFIFKNQDVYLPAIPEPLFGSAFAGKHSDIIDLNEFKRKFGDISLSYMLYNAFMLGYDSGMQNAENNSLDEIKKNIDSIVEKSEKIDIKFSNLESESLKEKFKSLDNKLSEKIMSKDINENNVEEKEEIKINEVKENSTKIPQYELLSKPYYDVDKKLVVDSNFYNEKTYPKFMSMIIEEKLNTFGMNIKDIEGKNFPSFILGEVLLEIQNQDTINDEQVEIKEEFYKYFQSLLDDITVKNTIS